MADEGKEQPEDIQGILSDLDAILSGIGDEAVAAPAPPAAPLKPAEPPKPVEPPKPPEVVAPPASAAESMKIDLPPRPGFISTPAKKEEPPKPIEPPKPVEAPKAAEPPKPAAAPPKPVEPPKPAAPASAAAAPAPAPAAPTPPAAAVPAAAPEDIPPNTPKDQIRRVAYVYTFACAEARAGFAAYLSQAARTISKKPIFLRSVMSAELSPSSDPAAVFEKARDAKAVAVLAVVEGWPPAKIEGLSEACARGGLMFRSVAPADVQKKSTAVDVIVDMMLLSGEA
ncbi:MAG TPA: hypothetical protein VN915_14020 [Elusimicrobiota bacterium]|nr:hypothetical protein [Elusimicrobiota bacterium]